MQKQHVLCWHPCNKTFIWLTQKSTSGWKTEISPFLHFPPSLKLHACSFLYFLPAEYPCTGLQFNCRITEKIEELATCLSLSYWEHKELLKEKKTKQTHLTNSLQITKQWWGPKFPRKEQCFKFRTPSFAIPHFSAKTSHSTQAACCQEIDSCNT